MLGGEHVSLERAKPARKGLGEDYGGFRERELAFLFGPFP